MIALPAAAAATAAAGSSFLRLVSSAGCWLRGGCSHPEREIDWTSRPRVVCQRLLSVLAAAGPQRAMAGPEPDLYGCHLPTNVSDVISRRSVARPAAVMMYNVCSFLSSSVIGFSPCSTVVTSCHVCCLKRQRAAVGRST